MANERKIALGMAQLLAPTSARLLWAMINARAALTFGSHGGEAQAGPGCRAVPRWHLAKGPEVPTPGGSWHLVPSLPAPHQPCWLGAGTHRAPCVLQWGKD